MAGFSSALGGLGTAVTSTAADVSQTASQAAVDTAAALYAPKSAAHAIAALDIADSNMEIKNYQQIMSNSGHIIDKAGQ